MSGYDSEIHRKKMAQITKDFNKENPEHVEQSKKDDIALRVQRELEKNSFEATVLSTDFFTIKAITSSDSIVTADPNSFDLKAQDKVLIGRTDDWKIIRVLSVLTEPEMEDDLYSDEDMKNIYGDY